MAHLNFVFIVSMFMQQAIYCTVCVKKTKCVKVKRFKYVKFQSWTCDNIYCFATTTTRPRINAFATSDNTTNCSLWEPQQHVLQQRDSDDYILVTTDSRQPFLATSCSRQPFLATCHDITPR